MRCIPFDRDAVPLYPRQAQRLIAASGFALTDVHFRFYFPRWLRPLRPLERFLTRLPLGAQYQVLAKKSSVSKAGAGNRSGPLTS